MQQVLINVRVGTTMSLSRAISASAEAANTSATVLAARQPRPTVVRITDYSYFVLSRQ